MAEPTPIDIEVTLQTLNYATRLLASELDTERLVDRALDTLVDFGRSKRVGLLRVEEDGQHVEVAGAMSDGGLIDPDRTISYQGTPLQEVIESRQLSNFGLQPDDPVPLPTATSDGQRECLCLPLIGSQNRVIAVATLERLTSDPLSEHDRQVLKVVATLIAVSIENARLFKLATVDGLTDLYVRRYFEIRLNEELRRLRRLGGSLALLITDIDHFKRVNDTRGHPEGDRVLRELAARVKGCIRKGIDAACRYGGEEFAMILPATDLAGAVEVAERVRQAVENQPVAGADGPISVTISGGVAAVDTDHLVSEEEFVRRADHALYQAKAGGRNQMQAWRGED